MGFDRDPLALLVAGCAAQSFDSSYLDQLCVRVLKRAEAAVRSGRFSLPQVRGELSHEDQEFIRYWFPAQAQKQLFALAASISDEPQSQERNLAWVVFSSLIIAKSAGASFALDISRSRPHKRTDKPVVLPFDGWDRRFKSAIKRLPFIDGNLHPESRVLRGDARALPLDSNTIDFVLTSPPYLNAIDYLRAHKFSLVWMGYSLGTLRELRGTMVGTKRGLWSLDGLPPGLEKRLDQKVKEDCRQALLRRYLSDLRKVMGEIQRVLRPNGLALLVMGPTVITLRRTDAVEVVTKIGKSVDLYTIGSVVRQLTVARRSLPPPSALKRNPLACRMRREVIVALRK
jgi:hypothetical protein